MSAHVEFKPDPELFPFESKFFESSVGRVHYVDEGSGAPVLLLHGNPDWSFLYRKIIQELRSDEVRCVAPDYPGFGLSVHPSEGYGFTSAEHAAVVKELLEYLDLKDFVVFGQDWGGPIGMWLACQMHERVRAVVMGNTWCWPADGFMFRAFAKVMRTKMVQRAILEKNFFVDFLMKRTLTKPISAAEFAHYTETSPSPEFRRGIAEFPKQILDAKDWLAEIEKAAVEKLRDKPFHLVFGRKDVALGTASIEARWKQMFPQAAVTSLPDANHYIQEDAPAAIVRVLRGALMPDLDG